MQPRLEKLVDLGQGSPFYQLLGIKIEEVRENYARLSIKVERKHIQFLRTVHGGVVASLADSAAAWAIYGGGDLRGIPVTVEMKINFLRPVRSGKLVAEARNIHAGTNVFVSDVEVKNRRGKLVAKSLLTYYLVTNKKG